jgi:hypothetical protein
MKAQDLNVHRLCCYKALLFSSFIAVVGCGKQDPLSSATGLRLYGLATAYLDFAAAKGAGPADQEQLRRHMSNMPSFVTGVDPNSIDASFSSERDGEPFVICYGQAISFSKSGQELPIAYEKSGKEGTRFVAFANGHVECLDANNSSRILLALKGF